MDIGLLTYYFLPENSAPTARICPFIEAWQEKGDAVHVYTHSSAQESHEGFSYDGDAHIHRTPTGKAKNTRSLPVRFLFEMLFCLSLFPVVLRRRVDVLVCTSPPFTVAVTTLLLSKLTATPYVVDVRDLFPEQLFAYEVLKRNSYFGRFLQWLERQLYNHALLVVGVTKGLTRYIRQRTDSDVVLVRNGIDSRHFYREKHQMIDGETAEAKNADTNEFIVLFHGTLGRSQNVELILTYAEHLKREQETKVKICVIGDGPKADTLRRGMENRNLNSTLDYVGRVDFEEIPQYLNRADVGFSPRVDGLVNETAFPVKVYECLGCGLPVIVTPESEAGRYVEQREVGFQHRNEEVERIHKSIRRLKENPKLYEEYSDRAVRIADSFDRHELGKTLHDEIAVRLQ